MKIKCIAMGAVCLMASVSAFLPHPFVSKPTSHGRLMAAPEPLAPDDEEGLDALQASLEQQVQLLADGVMTGMELKRHESSQLKVADNFAFAAPGIQAPSTTEKPVKITFSKGSALPEEDTFDLLVIASDPNELADAGVLKLTVQEKEVYNNFKNAAFQTTLLEVDPAPEIENSVRFNPGALVNESGGVTGYRSETRKTFQKLPKNATKEFLTVYQFLDPNKHGDLDTTQLLDVLKNELKEQEALPGDEAWFPYKYSTAKVIGEPFYTKYFNRFDLSGLREELPWKLIGLQGEAHTINVHGSCCFESVLHIYDYINLLAKERPDIFPSNKHNTKIGIVGGGPSGLLAARKFGEMGYNESKIVIFEKKDNFVEPLGNKLAGKTQTRTQIQLEVSEKPIPVELGTCYLSPAYNQMMRDLSNVTIGNKRIEFTNTSLPFRGIVATGEFSPKGPVMTLWNAGKGQLRQDIGQGPKGEFPTIIDYKSYILVKAFEETGTVSGSDPIPQLEKDYGNIPKLLMLKTVEYCLYHRRTFGRERPMPFECPDELKNQRDLGGMTIEEFLEEKDFKALIGTLQYSYSVQGYGSLYGQMPAWYLLTWITPQSMIPSLRIMLGNVVWIKRFLAFFGAPKPQEVVTALSRGWGDVWVQQKEKLDEVGVTTHYGTKISSITRKQEA